ncbi:hypothetical protein GX586_15030, partial [bacterium]|nr:hypothetical protein [bacterium]
MPTAAKHPANLIRERGASTSGINLGGIGTGGVELWPDGRLHFWNIANSMPWSSYHKIDDPAIVPHLVDPIQPAVMDADFMIRIKEPGRRPAYRWLFTGYGLACGTASHFFRHHKYFFIKGFPEIEYRAEYPFIHLRYIDPSLPIELSLRAWTPFIPRDVKNSSLPGAYFDFTVKNKTRRQVDVSIIWQMQNISGYAAPAVTQKHVQLRRDGAEIVQMMGSLAAPEHDTSGDMAIWAKPQRGQKATAVSANPYMQNLIWSIHLTGGLSGPLMPERLKHEELNETPRPGAPNKGWLAMQQQVRGNATAAMSFGLAWFFPNHYSIRATRVGHMYENWFGSSADVAAYLAKRRDALLEQSALLPSELMRSSLPETLKLALLDQLSTVTKSSHFIKNGRVGVQEGHGCCAFNTVDVDHYASYALSILFPSLREKIMEMHTSMAHPLNGKINHGPPATVEELPAGGDDSGGYNRWDNCCQYTLQLYRDAKWSGNRAMIDAAYQTARRAMKLVADLDFYGIGLPYIEGGITYDHWDMRGVVGYMAGVYLAGLRALEDMAGIVGDAETQTWARERFDAGVRAFEEYLWNGTQ